MRVARRVLVGVVTVSVMLTVTAGGVEAASLRTCDDVAREPGADLRRCDLRGEDLLTADLTGADLRAADLSGAELGGDPDSVARLDGADLRRVTAVDADMSDLTLRDVDLRWADLSGTSFIDSSLRNVDASGATLGPGDAGITDSTLRGTNLQGGFLDTYVADSDLRHASFHDVDFIDDARFFDVDLSHARGLDGVPGVETAVWSDTICPDRTNSDDNGGTCLGHLASSASRATSGP